MDHPRKFFKRAWQQEAEFGSVSGFRGGMDLSTVPMHDPLDHRQSDAGAFFFRRKVQAEDLFAQRGIDARARVGDPDLGHVRIRQ